MVLSSKELPLTQMKKPQPGGITGLALEENPPTFMSVDEVSARQYDANYDSDGPLIVKFISNGQLFFITYDGDTVQEVESTKFEDYQHLIESIEL